jgi:hypothetical protein
MMFVERINIKNMLVAFWLADKVIATVGEKKRVGGEK